MSYQYDRVHKINAAVKIYELLLSEYGILFCAKHGNFYRTMLLKFAEFSKESDFPVHFFDMANFAARVYSLNFQSMYNKVCTDAEDDEQVPVTC